MPTVPGSSVPEGLGQNGPIVGPSEPAGPMVERPSPTNMLMAAATMKDLGRFDAPADPTPKVRGSHGRRR